MADHVRVVSDERNDLLPVPEVKSPFPQRPGIFGRWAIRIFGRRESSLPIRHVPEDVIKRTARGRHATIITRYLENIEARLDQLCLVIEHLLKMRHSPLGIDGIAVEPAADLIVHPSRCHHRQRVRRHLPCVRVPRPVLITKEKHEDRRTGKLGACAETAVLGIIGRSHLIETAVEELFPEGRLPTPRSRSIAEKGSNSLR